MKKKKGAPSLGMDTYKAHPNLPTYLLIGSKCDSSIINTINRTLC